jgi:hypothetical protein
MIQFSTAATMRRGQSLSRLGRKPERDFERCWLTAGIETLVGMMDATELRGPRHGLA